MQKVRVLAESVSSFLYLVQLFALVFELVFPLLVIVVRLGSLKAIQNAFVVVGDAGDFFNPDSSVKRCVGVKSIGVGLWLFKHARYTHVLRLFQVYLKHFAEEDSILVLDLTHAL